MNKSPRDCLATNPFYIFVFNSKRLRLDDSCNNNFNSTLNSASKNSGKWTCSGDGNLAEAGIFEDMGVSMLEDEASSYENAKKSRSPEGATLATASKKGRQCEKVNSFDSQESIYRGSSFETASIDRFVFYIDKLNSFICFVSVLL